MFWFEVDKSAEQYKLILLLSFQDLLQYLMKPKKGMHTITKKINEWGHLRFCNDITSAS